jgi:hypothetical protein
MDRGSVAAVGEGGRELVRCAGAGIGGHQRIDDELGTLASVVVARIFISSRDRLTRDDCWQLAYLRGLRALAGASARSSHISRDVVKKAMRTAIFRALRKERRETREADLDVVFA